MPARPPRALLGRALLAFGATALVAACGASEAASPPPVSGTVGGVGSLPAPLADRPAPTSTAPATTEPAPTSSAAAKAAADDVLGEAVDANRVILIGDSLMASTSRRYGGQMCAALVPLGWAVEVDAETGRFIDFGKRVLDKRLRPDQGVDWDVAVIFLGNNYNGDEATYRAGLEAMLQRLAPRPVVLLTVTEFRPDRAEVNDVVRSLAATYPNVRLIDWNAVTEADPSLLGGDGLHLTDAGRGRLAFEVAAVLGAAPTGEPPACLSTSFSDDSAVALPSVAGSGSRSGGTRTTTTLPRSGSPTTTVARPAPTTTVGTPSPTTTAAAPPSPTTTLPKPPSATAPPPTPPPQQQPTPTTPPPTGQ